MPESVPGAVATGLVRTRPTCWQARTPAYLPGTDPVAGLLQVEPAGHVPSVMAAIDFSSLQVLFFTPENFPGVGACRRFNSYPLESCKHAFE